MVASGTATCGSTQSRFDHAEAIEHRHLKVEEDCVRFNLLCDLSPPAIAWLR
jgi:hypothetical protein